MMASTRKPINLTLPPDLVERAKKVAGGQGQSLSTYITGLLELGSVMPTAASWSFVEKKYPGASGAEKGRLAQAHAILSQPKPSKENQLREKVRAAIDEAGKITDRAMLEFVAKRGDRGVCGNAWVKFDTKEHASKDVFRALVALGLAEKLSRGTVYSVEMRHDHKGNVIQSLAAWEAGYQAGATYLTQALRQPFYMFSMVD